MSVQTKIGRPAEGAKRIPPLRNGDRLTGEEYDRRYEAMPDVRAELIEGVVYLMASPVRCDDHGEPHFDAIYWLGTYRARTPGVRGGDNSTMRLDIDNRPQPDAYLRITTECGGQSRVENGYIVGAVELAVEVAASSASYDLYDKLNVYRKNGVREYVVWRAEDGEVDWFIMRGDRYDRLTPGPDGILRSETFPGLWLDSAALIRGDMARVDEVARQGLATPEHADFVDRLRQRAEQAAAPNSGG
jgi:Uma2 family endonuclease